MMFGLHRNMEQIDKKVKGSSMVKKTDTFASVCHFKYLLMKF